MDATDSLLMTSRLYMVVWGINNIRLTFNLSVQQIWLLGTKSN
jgi:hypothetical protein